ncbi:hypothetical protein, partial [Streptomyces lunaelactis]|uniref:hypothetical protein n=1 Tax=Streptomyces lunaelactis TaxID=1535768 RepID=UPI001C30C053
PVKVVTYALTSANDHAERDPRDWSLKGSADGKEWKVLDSRGGTGDGGETCALPAGVPTVPLPTTHDPKRN